MKKIVLYIPLAVCIFAVSFFVSHSVTAMLVDDGYTVASVPALPVDTVEITISAVGDCTLGTDVSFSGAGSFPAELAGNDKDYSYFLSGVRSYFEDDDLTIVNLEGTLSDRGTRAKKTYAFRGKPQYAQILSGSSVEAANLANNHTMDYGKAAYEDTKRHLSANGITSFGSSDISVMDIKGIKVGLIGTSALSSADRTNYPKAFKELKAMSPDLIIATFHWGAERAIKPNRDQISLARTAIDNGADLVIGHHPHVLQGVEKYKGKYIVYSLGNFCFGGNKNPVDKDTMIFRQTFTFEKGSLTEDDNAGIIPCSVSSVQNRNNYQPVPLKGADFKRVVKKIVNRSADYDGIENVSFIGR